MKNKRGITLIALIITIIVLLILAGVSISIVVGDNGVLKQAQESKIKTDLASAKEALETAIVTIQSEYYEKCTENVNLDIAEVVTVKKLNSELKKLGYELYYGNTLLEESIFKNTHTIGMTLTTSIKSIENQNIYKIVLIKKNSNSIEISKFEVGDSEGEFLEYPYLVDIVNIGDYIDIGIDYQNISIVPYKKQFTKLDYSSTGGPVGWRVISKNGSGSKGTVQLISAGCPLAYYHKFEIVTSSIDRLNEFDLEHDLKKTGTSYFNESGFENSTYNMLEIFNDENNNCIDISKGIHAVKTTEILTLFNMLNNTEIDTMSKLNWSNGEIGKDKYILNSNVMNLNASDRAVDLLCNGIVYWPSENPFDDYHLWYIDYNGHVYRSADTTHGIRPVISLVSGIKVSDNNLGNGSSYNLAYEIIK